MKKLQMEFGCTHAKDVITSGPVRMRILKHVQIQNADHRIGARKEMFENEIKNQSKESGKQ